MSRDAVREKCQRCGEQLEPVPKFSFGDRAVVHRCKPVADTAIGRRDASDWDEKKEQYEFFEENFRLDADTAAADQECACDNCNICVEQLREEVRRLQAALELALNRVTKTMGYWNESKTDNKRLREALEEIDKLCIDGTVVCRRCGD